MHSIWLILISIFFLFLGSSTACVLVLHRETSTLYTANIGDSGFIVVRKGEIVHRSEEQQHYFNTPFQLSLPPPGHGHNVLSDSPESADTLSFPVKEGDVILVATDGVFDNVPVKILLDVLKEVSKCLPWEELLVSCSSLIKNTIDRFIPKCNQTLDKKNRLSCVTASLYIRNEIM